MHNANATAHAALPRFDSVNAQVQFAVVLGHELSQLAKLLIESVQALHRFLEVAGERFCNLEKLGDVLRCARCLWQVYAGG
jgi:hypothetical protein